MTCAAVVMAGCQQSVDVPHHHPEDECGESTVRIIAMTEAPDTKTTFSWDDSHINDLQIIVTEEDGKLAGSIYTQSISDIDFRGVIGTTYEIRAVANVGHEIEGASLSDFLEKRLEVSHDDIESHGMPMACSEPVRFTVTKKYDTVTLPLKRMLARIDFNIDRSRLTHADNENGFVVRSVKVFNAINSYNPFAESNRQTKGSTLDYSFDFASTGDLSDLNSELGISVYAFENMQGDLLVHNQDPWGKVPENIPGSECCTYLEVEASYSAQGLSSENVTYRMYLGDNNTSNFDVRRNTIYRITLIPTEEEMDGHRASWKIDSQDWDDGRTLCFNPDVIEIPSGGSGVAHVSMTPEHFETLISHTAWLEAADCTVSYDIATQDVTIKSHTELDEDITDFIRVDSWDGRLSDMCQVTIKKVTNPVVDIYLKGQSRAGIFISDYSIVMQQGKQLGIVDAGITYVFKDGTEHTVTSLNDEMLLKTGISLKDLSASLCFTYKKNVLASDNYSDAGDSGTLELHYSDDESDFTKDINLLIVDRKFVEFYTDYAHYVEVGDIAYIHLYAAYEDGFRFQPSKFAFDFIYLDIPDEYSDIAQAINYNASIAVEGLSVGTCPAQLVFRTKSEPVSGFPLNREYSLPTSIVVHDGGTMTLEPESRVIQIGESYELVAKVFPDWNSDRCYYVTPQYESSDENVAVVSPDGRVTGVGPGTAIITASFYGEESNFKYYSCTSLVTVQANETVTYFLEIIPDSVVLKEGEETYLKAVLHTITNGIDDGGQDISTMCSWSSEDKDVAHVSLGHIIAKGLGSTDIKVEYDDMLEIVPVTVISDVPDLKYVYELVIPESVSMGISSTASLKAYLVKHTYNGDEEVGNPESTDVTSRCSWTSSDPDTAEVGASDGKVTAKSVGTAIIKAVLEDDTAGTLTSNSCTVRVTGDSGLGVKISWGNASNIINIGF